MTSATATSGGPAATEVRSLPPGRGRRFAAVLFDFVTAALAVVAAALVATLWLLLRTGWGRHDPTSGEALVAVALVLAAPPAWAAWQLAGVVRGAGTAGQRRLALAVAPVPRGLRSPRTAALLRLAYHPLALVAWLWLATVALMLGMSPIAVALLAVGGIYAAGGLCSAVLVLRASRARALHDRLAGTRLVRR